MSSISATRLGSSDKYMHIVGALWCIVCTACQRRTKLNFRGTAQSWQHNNHANFVNSIATIKLQAQENHALIAHRKTSREDSNFGNKFAQTKAVKIALVMWNIDVERGTQAGVRMIRTANAKNYAMHSQSRGKLEPKYQLGNTSSTRQNCVLEQSQSQNDRHD